ncbi:conserved hypothetical protein [Ricinus communis]|uniref:Reverse transcriptase zinc-binding domain-containing protein n=1 Tax=Ricinus communis TaxID=3988 RepID=B9SEW2_RICCO|nr:conserved hypothetical protein [Ricinus communis]
MDKPWAQVLKGLYFPRNYFLSTTAKGRQSWFWIPGLKGFRLHLLRPPYSELTKVVDLLNTSKTKWDENKIRSITSNEEARVILDIPLARACTVCENGEETVKHILFFCENPAAP